MVKNALFLLSRAPTQQGFTFNLQFWYALKHKSIYQKLCVEFSIFDSVSFLLMFIFLLNNMHGFFEFKTL